MMRKTNRFASILISEAILIIVLLAMPLLNSNVFAQAVSESKNNFQSSRLTNNKILQHAVKQTSSTNIYPKVACGYAGSAGSLTINWRQLAGNISSFSTAIYDKKFLPKLRWLKQQGVNLSMGIDWRVHQATNPNPLDFCYNLTFRNEVFNYFENIFDIMPDELISAIVVGDEEPNNGYQWFTFSDDTWPEEIAKYNQTYHEETGFWFKNINKMNATERISWQHWMETKNSFAYNTMYDYLKGLYPDKKVIIALMENYHWGFNPANISTDERSGYQFYTKDPRRVYSAIRYAKTSYPDATVGTVLWGTEKYGFYEDYTEKDFKRLAYAAYLAGADKIDWFMLGEDEIGRGLLNWQRIDQKGKEVFDCINAINRELMQLPVFRPAPKILEIADYDTAGNSEGIGFVEWDNTNQIHASAPDFNLSKYDLIVLKDQANLLSELVTKINDYVQAGGHLIIVGSTASATTDPYGISRPQLIFEEATAEYNYYNSPFNISLDGNNDLGVFADIPMTKEGRIAIKYTANSNYHFISTGAPEEKVGHYPLMFYHNDSNPQSGYVLYYGFSLNWENELLPLWFNTLNAFADLIDFHEGIATENTAKMLVSISEFPDEDRFILGYVNDEQERSIFSYNFDFAVRGLTEEPLWFYQYDRIIEWVGEVGFYEHATTLGIAPFKAEDAVLFELLPPWPVGRLVVNTYALQCTPVVNEALVVHGDVRNILQYTQVKNVNASIELPEGLEFADPSIPSTLELGYLYSAIRSGFGYPMGFSWSIKALEAGNYTIKITVEGVGLEPVIKYVNIEVQNAVVDVMLIQRELYLTPNETYSWKVGVHLRGTEQLENVKIWLYYPNSDWYAPHKEMTIDLLKPGEYREIDMDYTLWYEPPPFWATPGEKITVICTSIVNGFVEDDTFGFVNVVASKIRLIGNDIELQEGQEIKFNAILETLGVEYAKDVKISLSTVSGIELYNSTEIMLGTIAPNEQLNLTFVITGIEQGIFHLLLTLTSSNAYCENVVITIKVNAEAQKSPVVLAIGGGVLIGMLFTATLFLATPKIMQLIRKKK